MEDTGRSRCLERFVVVDVVDDDADVVHVVVVVVLMCSYFLSTIKTSWWFGYRRIKRLMDILRPKTRCFWANALRNQPQDEIPPPLSPPLPPVDDVLPFL